MKRVLNIRGAHCSGKTSAVREYILQHNGRVETIGAGKYNSEITLLDNSTAVLGRYDKGGCEGADRYKTFAQVKRTILEIYKRYGAETIIFEGIMISTVFKGSVEIAELCRSIGYQYVAVLFEREREQALEYITIRNGGRTINMEKFDRKISEARVAARKLKNAGYRVVRKDVTGKSIKELAEVIENV